MDKEILDLLDIKRLIEAKKPTPANRILLGLFIVIFYILYLAGEVLFRKVSG